MSKSDLELRLKHHFSTRKWELERIARLPAAFVHPTPVTPFFQPRVLRLTASHYLIDGYLGTLHRKFEARWIASNPESSKVNSHCLALNVANIDILRAAQNIDIEEVEKGISRFCASAMRQLEILPDDAASFESAIERGVLMNMPFEKFLIHGREKKLSCLKLVLVSDTRTLN
jgi:hypothetical protein